MAKIFRINTRTKNKQEKEYDDLAELDAYMENLQREYPEEPQPKKERLKFLYQRLERADSAISSAKYYGGKISVGGKIITLEQLIEERNSLMDEIQAVKSISDPK